MPPPITTEALSGLQQTVLWSTFALAFAFGAVAQRTHFCTMGAVADIVSFGDWTRMRQWLLAMAVAIIGTGLLTTAGLIDTANAIYTTPRFTLASYLFGGLLFGVGMVLAGGCGSKTLVRVGGGNLKSLVVLLVIGVTAFITLRGALGVVRVNYLEPLGTQLATTQDLPSLLAARMGLSPSTLRPVLSLLVGAALASLALKARDFRNFDNLLAGIAIGGVIIGLWFVSGVIGHVDEHPLTLEETFIATNSGRMESLTFIAPIAYTLDWLMFFSDTSKVITLGVAAVIGVVAGSATQALASRSFRWEGFANTEDTAHHIIGGMLMGFGGITALGCTIGQGLSGVSTLAVGSMLTWLSIVSGAVVALRYQAWRLGKIG